MASQPLPRRDTIHYKLMPDGHIRAYQAGTPDKRGVSEGNIYPPPYLRTDSNHKRTYKPIDGR